MVMDPIEALHRRAAAGGFTLTPGDADDCHLSRRAFTRHLRRLGWGPRHRGHWLPEDLSISHEAATGLAVRAIGPPVAATAGTALWLDGVIDEPPAVVQLLVPDGRRIREHDGVRIRTTTRYAGIVRHTRQEISIVSAWRALADYSSDCSLTELITTMADANRLRLCPLDRVKDEVALRKRFPGRGRLRRAHGELTGELTHSHYERMARGHLRDVGLSFHPRPFPVVVDERVIAEIDIAFVELRYGVEVDGPPHLLLDVAAHDRRRDRQLNRQGWRIDRFLWTDVLEHPEEFVRDVQSSLARLGGAVH